MTSPAPELEGLTLGQTATLSVEVTAATIDAFVALSGDNAPLHTDADYARSQGFDGRLVHGALVGALISRFVGTVLPGRRSLLQRMDLRFRAPCYEASSLTIRGEIAQLTGSVRSVAVKITVTDGEGRLVVTARTVHIMSRLGPEPSRRSRSESEETPDGSH